MRVRKPRNPCVRVSSRRCSERTSVAAAEAAWMLHPGPRDEDRSFGGDTAAGRAAGPSGISRIWRTAAAGPALRRGCVQFGGLR